MTNLDQEIDAALARATLSDRNAAGTYGAGHSETAQPFARDRGYYEGLLRAKQVWELPGGAIQFQPGRPQSPGAAAARRGDAA